MKAVSFSAKLSYSPNLEDMTIGAVQVARKRGETTAAIVFEDSVEIYGLELETISYLIQELTSARDEIQKTTERKARDERGSQGGEEDA